MKKEDDNQNFEKYVQHFDYFFLSFEVKPMDPIVCFAQGMPFFKISTYGIIVKISITFFHEYMQYV